jgi:hypothetical protein
MMCNDRRYGLADWHPRTHNTAYYQVLRANNLGAATANSEAFVRCGGRRVLLGGRFD